MIFLVLCTIGVCAYLFWRFDKWRTINELFAFSKAGRYWRAYFKKLPPSYSHVLFDLRGYYVCWDRPLRTKEDAVKVATLWLKRYG